ncbi:hypothetical protein Bca4012_022860 [Brassica carinata]
MAKPEEKQLLRKKKGEDDIVELLWKSGHVVESSQAQRPPVPPPILRGSGSGGEGTAPLPLPQPAPLNTHQQPSDDKNLLIREDEMPSFLLREEYDFHSHLFYSTTPFTQPQGSSVSLTPPGPPPQSQPPPASVMYTPTPAERPSPMGQVIGGPRRAENFFDFSRLRGNIHTGSRVEAAAAQWVKESTQVGSSATPSSSAPESCLTPATVTGGVAQTFVVPSLSQKVVETAAGPSSSGFSETETEPFQIQPATETEAADERKRKEREEPADDTEKTGEEGRGSTSRKKSRAAEMHNISERRRREKINEKMKVLQELIPRCNKTDKVSMLEDAIEYVKSLQLQIQMMSTGGGGMMPMMYNPNLQRFMPPSAMGMMGMNRPPFIPFPGTAFPRPAHTAAVGPPYPAPPRYPFPNVQAFDPSSVHLPTQLPDPNQPQFPGYLNPYSQFVGLQQMQQPPPTQLQNQTASQPSISQASSSKEPEDHDNKPIGKQGMARGISCEMS